MGLGVKVRGLGLVGLGLRNRGSGWVLVCG